MATYTVANGGGNINAASTYVGGVGIPGVADEIVFTTTSGQLTVNVVTTIQDINFSNYTNVITFSGTLNVSRNITFGDAGGLSTYTTAGAGGIQKTGTGNLTSNGKTWTAPFTFGAGTYTVTLMDLCTFSGDIVFANNNITTLTPSNVLDPERFNIIGNFTISGGGALTGTALIKFTGTSNQTLAANTAAVIRTNLKIDKTANTLTITGNFNYNTGTFTYVQGTVNTGTSTLVIGTQPVTLDTKGSSSAGATTTSSTGINWYNISAGSTITLTSDLTAVNNFSSSTGAVTFSGTTQKVYLGGGLTASNTITSSSVETIFNGTGTWSGTSAVSCLLTINTLGTITITGNVSYTTRTFTYTSGTNTGAGTIIFGTNTTLNLGANKLNVNAALVGNITLSSNTTFTNLTTQTTAVVFIGAFTVNVEGNFAINIATSGASTPIVLNGTGSQSWTHGSAVYLSNNLTINKASGTLTLGANVYYTTGTLTYTQGDVDAITNSSTIIFGNTSTFNNNNLVVNNLQLLTNSAVLTLNSDLTCLGQIVLGQGGKTITGASNINCNSFRFANNINAGYIYNFNSCIIYTNDLLLEGAISGSAFNLSNGTFYVNRDLYVTGGVGHAGHYYGNSNIIMTGTGVLSTTSGLTAPLTINTSGKITVSSILYLGAQGPSGSGGTTFTYLRGNVIANKSKLSLEIAFNQTYTLNNMNKIVWGSVGITSGMTITMNEFFNGDAYTQTNITTTSTTNAVISFTDNFEKIAKFVNMNGLTFTRPQQLLLITNQPKKSRNIGIRYNNQSPNGINKGDLSVQNLQTVGQSRTLLLGDPAFVKSI